MNRPMSGAETDGREVMSCGFSGAKIGCREVMNCRFSGAKICASSCGLCGTLLTSPALCDFL